MSLLFRVAATAAATVTLVAAVILIVSHRSAGCVGLLGSLLVLRLALQLPGSVVRLGRTNGLGGILRRRVESQWVSCTCRWMGEEGCLHKCEGEGVLVLSFNDQTFGHGPSPG